MKALNIIVIGICATLANCGVTGGIATLFNPAVGGDESMMLLPMLAGVAGASGSGTGGGGGGAGSAQPEIRLTMGGASHSSGGIYDMGNQVVNTTGTSSSIVIENTGTSELRLTGAPVISAGGTDPGLFNLTQPGSAVLGVGATTTASVAFSPTTTGVKTASLNIANNDADEGAYVINLMGTSTSTPEPEISVDVSGANFLTGSTHNYGIILVNTGSPITITIRNTGSATLNLTGTPRVVLGGTHASEFAVTQPGTASIAASSNASFTATFQPTNLITLGTKNATLTIQCNDSDEPNFVIQLTGFSVLSL